MRSFKKYQTLGLDEEKDFFLASLNKKVRNAKKKLDAIDDLSKKDKSTLKAEQLEKIASRSEVLDNIRYTEDIKEMYFIAYKTAKEEGKAPQSAIEESTTTTKPVEQKPVEVSAPQTQQQGQSEEERQAELAQVTRDNLSKVLNLVHLAQFFRDQGNVQEFKQSLPDLESLYEFYTKVFTFSESDKFVKIEDKLQRSLGELVSYVNSVQQPALKNRSYEFLQNVVESTVESSFFREHTANVTQRPAKTGAEPSAIGSELKKGHEQVEEKHKSPEKEVKHQEPTKVSPVKEAKRDWGTVEDEEEESVEEVREEEQQEQNFEGEGGRVVEETQPEEQKQVDEWATVTAKHKERREEKPTRGGKQPYRGGDRGQRRPRPEGEGDQKRERRPRPEGEGQEGAGENAGRGGRGGYRGGNRGGSGRGGFQKREGHGDEYRKREGGDVYQKKTEGADKTTATQ